jgi:hypothetical protein
MNKNFALLPVFLVASFLIVVTVTTSTLSRHPDNQLKLTLITTAIGGLIALMSAVLLMLRAASGTSLQGVMPLTIPLLAGILIASYHWSIAVVLGTICLALIIREMVGTPAERRGQDQAPSAPEAENC